jgi:hypothetical protein
LVRRRVAQPRIAAVTAVRELRVKRREVERALAVAIRTARDLDKPLTLRELARITGLSVCEFRCRVA